MNLIYFLSQLLSFAWKIVLLFVAKRVLVRQQPTVMIFIEADKNKKRTHVSSAGDELGVKEVR